MSVSVRRLAQKVPIPAGHKRQWVQCCKCRRLAFYDFVPYSLSNPVHALPCGHGAGQRWTDAVKHLPEPRP